MIGRRATVGLSLFCALLFCAFAAQSASAASATNTTAFTCVEIAAGTGAFTDAHCDSKGKGNFEHQELTAKIGETTQVIVTNEKTASSTTASEPAVLKGEPFKVKTEITCTVVSGSGTLGNTEPSAKVHKVSGKITTNFSKCTVAKPAKCTVKEPIVVAAETEGVEGLGAGKNEMGVEFKPEGGKKTFTTITLEGAECPLKGLPFNIEGTAIATGGTATQTEKHSGATAVFTKAMTEKTLKAAEKFAWFSAKTTVRMEGAGGNPITLTTVT